MARKKAARDANEDHWAYYRSIQLTPEQKAEARARAELKMEEARRNGVYERLLAMAGKIHLDMEDLERVREDKD